MRFQRPFALVSFFKVQSTARSQNSQEYLHLAAEKLHACCPKDTFHAPHEGDASWRIAKELFQTEHIEAGTCSITPASIPQGHEVRSLSSLVSLGVRVHTA